MMTKKKIFAQIVIDFEYDNGRMGSYEADSYATEMVIEHAKAHLHTIENGINITDIKARV